jgi:hypothetical protein
VGGGGWRVEDGGWRVEGGRWRWRVEGGGWREGRREEGGGWRVEGEVLTGRNYLASFPGNSFNVPYIVVAIFAFRSFKHHGNLVGLFRVMIYVFRGNIIEVFLKN